MNYTIRTEPAEGDVYYILEEDSKELFRFKKSAFMNTYSLFGHNKELVKIVMHHNLDTPKEATDYFVEETFNL